MLCWRRLAAARGTIDFVPTMGAPISHAAIVAWELGVPALVNCGDATACLCTGDRALVDGVQGEVEILQPGARGAGDGGANDRAH
jgi:pyruvate,water dikinase